MLDCTQTYTCTHVPHTHTHTYPPHTHTHTSRNSRVAPPPVEMKEKPHFSPLPASYLTSASASLYKVLDSRQSLDCIHIQMYTYTHTNVHIHTHTHAHTHTHPHTHTHTHTQTHTHTHTHTSPPTSRTPHLCMPPRLRLCPRGPRKQD
jgi:hypothetical protein